jgi:tetratricopeptide (TPR) repeat protein
MPGQLCFVLMPCGQKPDAGGAVIDFDAVYRDVIAPAIRDADMEPLRADEEVTGGLIHKAMFERLILCDYAVADLTTANANVFYELGVRHAVRPWSTVALFAKGSRLPFDVTMLRAIPYTLTPAGTPDDIDATRKSLTAQLSDARKAIKDSPVFTLIEGMSEQQIDREKTDTFRDRVSYSQHLKDRLAAARQRGGAAVQAVESELGNIADAESGVVIDLFLSYRAVRAWGDMTRLVERMSPPLAATVMVQEQLALALNRAGDGAQAETVLTRLLEKRGPSSETYSILGRVYKDRWEEASKDARRPYLARGLLDKAIDAYVRGFEADWRDAYPGINAVTLMELRDQPDPHQQQLLPVVAYAVERRIAAGKADYWDHATRLELAVLARDEAKAESALANALAAVREPWEPETTAHNLRLIREAREQRHTSTSWATQMEEVLLERSKA